MTDITVAALKEDTNALAEYFAKSARAFVQENLSTIKLLAAARSQMFSVEELKALEAVGVNVCVDPDITPWLEGEFERRTLLETAFSIQEAAKCLGVTTSRLRQRVGEGSISAMKSMEGRSWLFPSWQFLSGKELPGLAMVMKSIPNDLSVLDVYGFFTTPQSDLEDDEGEAVTPLAWLSLGRDPLVVAKLGAQL